MKNFLIVLLAVALTGHLRADDNDLIENGDFTDGINHWYGGGRSPSDFADDNPMAQNDPFTSKGLIVPLHPETWVKVAQDFKGKASSAVLRITYMVSKDFALSTKSEDYLNMPSKIEYNAWAPFNIPLGTWVVFVSDFGSSHGTYYELKPKPGSSNPQTYTSRIQGMTPYENKTITLAFPPGAGTLVVLNVSVTSQ